MVNSYNFDYQYFDDLKFVLFFVIAPACVFIYKKNVVSLQRKLVAYSTSNKQQAEETLIKNLFYMKHRFTLLFALLCASMMTWAAEPITGSSTENMAGQGNPFTNGYDYSFSSEGTNVTISFTEKENYVGLEAYLWDYTTGGMVETKMTVSGSTATITLTEQTPGATIRFACKFAYSGGMSVTKEFTYTIPIGDGGGGGTETGVIDWSSISWLENGEGKYKLVIEPAIEDRWGGKRIEGTNLWIGFPSAAFGTMSIEPSGGDGAWRTFALSNFLKRENKFTVVCEGTTYTFTVYNDNGEPEDLTGWNIAKGKTSVAGHYPNENRRPSLANDGKIEDGDSRWTSEGAKHYAAEGEKAEDWWYVDLGDFYSIETIKILFETASPTDYDLLISNNALTWTVIGTYTEAPNTGNSAEKYNVYEFSDKVGRYVKIFARNGYSNLAYGFSMYEFEVYGERASVSDVTPPTMGTVSLSGTPTHDKISIAVSATDTEDGMVSSFHVVDETNGINQSCDAVDGVITVTGLNEDITYNFIITAVDAAGNESENAATIQASTTIDNTIPQSNAAVPTATNKDVLPIYSDAFTSILDHPFDKDGWAGVALYKEKNIGGDSYLLYNIASANEIIWGMYDDGANAIIAAEGYRAEGHMGVDASAMEYLHIDLWSKQACSIGICINDQSLKNQVAHTGSGWEGFDIPLSEFNVDADVNKQTNNVRWFKFNNLGSITGKVAIDNVYFWKNATGNVEVESIALDPSEATIEIGESKTLVPIFTPAYAVGQTLTWTSNNESIVSVSSDGVIVGNAVGEAVITATSANEKTATCNITVEPISEKTWWGLTTIAEWDNMPVMYSITRNIDRTLTYTVYFGGDASGEVMQINNGAWNTLTGYTDSERKASFTTTTTYESGTQIKPDHFFYFGGPRIELANEYVVGTSNEKPSTAVESVVISHSTASLMKDETIQLVASVVPAYADDKTLIWSSEDTNIATVANGVVTANAIGTTTITATSANGKTATCNVTVEALTEKTCWGVGNNFEYKETEVSYHYAFTRNADKTLTITAEFSHDITGIGNLNIVWNDIYHLMAYNATTKTATYTTVAGDTYETDAILPNAFFYFEGRRTDVTYIVGSVCDKPIVDVTGVEISNETKKLLTGETFTITANVIPANADNKNIIWSNSNPSVASIDEASGLVTALTTGTTIITATSQFDANLYATCEVTVVGALEPATWYGTAVFKVKGNPVAVNYSITRTSDRTLTYRTVLSETVTGMSMQLNDGEYRLMTQDETVRIAEWTSTNTYEDGATHSMFFYPAFEGGADRWDVDYVVGSSNEKPNTLVAFGDQADNTAKITEYADEVVDAYINRTFPNTDEWYTLCLPFDMDEAQLAATFGAGYTLATLGGSEDRGSLIHLNFDYVNTLVAGKPYLLKPGVSTVTVPMIEAVTIKSAAPQKAESAHMQFQGTFAPTTLEGDNKRFVGPNNYLYSPAVGGTSMGAFRCYFTIPVESQALVGSKAARIVFGPQVTTGTENVQSDQVQSTKVIIDGTLYIIRGERTYNAQGQLVK